MRSLQIPQFGIDNLQFVEQPDPKPGPGQVLLSMRSWSLNYRDLMTVEGRYNPKMKLPQIPLSDGAGEVVATGEGAQRFQVGDRVVGAFMQKWIDGEIDDAKGKSALGGAIPGVAAELVVLDEEGLVAIPESMTFEEAATLPCAGVTAWNALTVATPFREGQQVLLLGTGGVSIFGLQIAEALSGKILITSSSAEKTAKAESMGANASLNYKEVPEWGERARELTGGIGVDHVLEVGGAGTLSQSIAAVRTGGVISLIGVLTEGEGLDPRPLLMRSIRLQGIYVGSRKMLQDLAAFLAAKNLKPVIDRVFPFNEMPEAFRAMKNASHFGKIVVTAA